MSQGRHFEHRGGHDRRNGGGHRSRFTENDNEGSQWRTATRGRNYNNQQNVMRPDTNNQVSAAQRQMMMEFTVNFMLDSDWSNIESWQQWLVDSKKTIL